MNIAYLSALQLSTVVVFYIMLLHFSGHHCKSIVVPCSWLFRHFNSKMFIVLFFTNDKLKHNQKTKPVKPVPSTYFFGKRAFYLSLSHGVICRMMSWQVRLFLLLTRTGREVRGLRDTVSQLVYVAFVLQYGAFFTKHMFKSIRSKLVE